MDLKTIKIYDISDTRISHYRSLKAPHPDNNGFFIAESKPVIKKLLKSDNKVISCLTTEKVEVFTQEDHSEGHL